MVLKTNGFDTGISDSELIWTTMSRNGIINDLFLKKSLQSPFLARGMAVVSDRSEEKAKRNR